MKAGERIDVADGWVSFGLELLLRADQVQSISVEPAAAANVPAVWFSPVATGANAEDPAAWFQLEVKYAPRSAPYVVFVGTELECRRKVGCLMRKLRGGSDG